MVDHNTLSEMTIKDLRKLNSIIIDMIDSKNNQSSLVKKASLKVGEIVTVNHKRLKGKKMEIIKINRTKAVLKEVGSNGSFNVPIFLIENQ
jgi:hypothetical protein